MGQDSWGNIFNGVVDELKLYNRALSVEEVRADYEAGLNGKANTLSGAVTGPESTGLANANVTLTTPEGIEINTTQTDSTGHYTFKAVSSGDYNLTATKTRYWRGFNPVNVTAEDPKTADIVLYMKGDFNINGDQADAGDLAKMADATVNTTLRDWTYDLNGNGEQADEDDLRLLKNVSVGEAVLE